MFSLTLVAFTIFCAFSLNQNYWLNWLGILIYLYAICTWHWRKGDSIFSLYTIFFTLFLLFSYGQCIMWAFGIGTDRGIGTTVVAYGTGIIPSESDMIMVKWYSCISMFVFHIGALLFTRKTTLRKVSWYESGDADADRKFLFKIGCIISIIVVPIVFVSKLLEVRIALVHGYNALYYGDYATQSGYLQIILYLFFPALICLLIGSNFSKVITRFVFIIFALYSLLGIMSGDRGSWLYSSIILIWAYTQYKGTFNYKKLIKWLILAVIGIYILNVITKARDGGGLSKLTLKDFTSVFDSDDSPLVDSFFEMGGTMSIITFFLISGNGIYPFANTYLTSLLGSISTRMLSMFGIKFVLLADWFSQDYLGITWGTGFSMIAEAYVNGGYIGGIVYIFIIGIVIGKILSNSIDNQDIENHPMKMFLAITTANIIMGFPRAASYLIVKNFVYGVLIILLINFFLQQFNK
ncbi:TPA: O-antigen polysaccharide polymerase Wzy, partial [Enterococcus faecium]|nr:O-antigen polysaccharide polymerase Wzy [Enterococcus faecium]